MATPIIINAKDDHHPGETKDVMLGVLYRNLIPTLICLGPKDYVGTLSINEVIRDEDGFHVTTRSMYVLRPEQLLSLKEKGRFDTEGGWIRIDVLET